MAFDKIKFLITNNKFKDALVKIKELCVGPLHNFFMTAEMLEGRVNEFNLMDIQGVEEAKEKNRIRKDLLSFVHLLQTNSPHDDQIEELLRCKLVFDNTMPFIDRKQFREKINTLIAAEKAQIVLIEGEPKSGMSHLEKFLAHVTTNLAMCKLHSFEIPGILDEPDSNLGEALAKAIALDLDLDINLDSDDKDQFKFIQFLTKLREKLRSEKEIPIFFFHDFHHIEDSNDGLLKFVYMLINSITKEFPKSIFILAGMDYSNLKNWHSDLKFRLRKARYSMESVMEEDVKLCLESVFGVYGKQIIRSAAEGISADELTKLENDEEAMNQAKKEYVQSSLQTLVPDPQNINIDEVGQQIMNFIYELE